MFEKAQHGEAFTSIVAHELGHEVSCDRGNRRLGTNTVATALLSGRGGNRKRLMTETREQMEGRGAIILALKQIYFMFGPALPFAPCG
jgi:hypothetical protein